MSDSSLHINLSEIAKPSEREEVLKVLDRNRHHTLPKAISDQLLHIATSETAEHFERILALQILFRLRDNNISKLIIENIITNTSADPAIRSNALRIFVVYHSDDALSLAEKIWTNGDIGEEYQTFNFDRTIDTSQREMLRTAGVIALNLLYVTRPDRALEFFDKLFRIVHDPTPPFSIDTAIHGMFVIAGLRPPTNKKYIDLNRLREDLKKKLQEREDLKKKLQER